MAAKTKTAYFCQSCGQKSAKWQGKCTACGEWNTLVEEVITPVSSGAFEWDKTEPKQAKGQSVKLKEVSTHQDARTVTFDAELNRVLGGGIVDGAIILLGGEPGIGKSTLLLQLALHSPDLKVLYVSGEESAKQIKLRADRIGQQNDECYLLTQTDTNAIFAQAKQLAPQILIIDSIQTLHSAKIEATPGSVSQIRECTGELQRFAKETNTAVFIIGHITKDGQIAGPKLLEHMVDVVLQFEGDSNYSYRLIRTHKNRFGSTAELGIYEMLGDGLRQVPNPSEMLLTQRTEAVSGIAIAATIEGMRPIMLETQALVANAFYGTPQRSATGYNTKRMSMLLAVLEKRAGFAVGNKDIFLNIAGGIKTDDPAVDLAILAALMSSFEDIAIDPKATFAGELSLSGEIRSVSRIEQRIAEADKIGFTKLYVSGYGLKGLDTSKYQIEVIAVNKVHELYQKLFEH